jgi:hypothetical protein
MDGSIFFAALAGIVLAIWASLNWVLGPLNRAAENREFPIQFSLADLLCLFVLVQLPVGIVHWATRGEWERGMVSGDVFFGLLAGLLWWNVARLLSRAGVHTVWQRCVALTFVVPGIIVGPLVVVVFPFAAFCSVMDKRLGAAGLWLLAEIPVVGILYGLGRFTRAIVASTKETETEQKPTS